MAEFQRIPVSSHISKMLASQLERADDKVNEPSSEANSDILWIDAKCIHCNKRFTSMRSVSMHLRGTANRHAVNFVNRRKYDKKTSMKILLCKLVFYLSFKPFLIGFLLLLKFYSIAL